MSSQGTSVLRRGSARCCFTSISRQYQRNFSPEKKRMGRMKTILQKNFSFLIWAVMLALLSPGLVHAQVNEDFKLLASDGAADDKFGWSVAVSGDTAVVGALGNPNRFRAYVFVKPATGWSGTLNEAANLFASDAATTTTEFGFSVAVSGDTALVGARLDDDGGSGSGSAYVFVKPALGGWVDAVEDAKLLASDGAVLDNFGVSVALDGDTAVVGAYLDDVRVITDAGSAYVFDLVFDSDSDGPITSNVLAGPNPAAVSESITLSAHIDDATTGGATIASADFEIRDGDANVVLSGTGSGTCSDSQLPCPDDTAFDQVDEDVAVTIDPGDLTPGVYNACVRGTDAPGNVGAYECTLLAVYDPSAWFVTGGGFVNSPSAADVVNGAAGPARFGFVSKYLPGRSIPDGNLEFQFQAGSLNFKSTSMDWLVVSGEPRGRFQGTGTINGSTVCKFVVDAWDGSFNGGVDAFGLRLFACGGAAADVHRYNLPATQLTRGSIIIHTR